MLIAFPEFVRKKLLQDYQMDILLQEDHIPYPTRVACTNTMRPRAHQNLTNQCSWLVVNLDAAN